MGVTERGLAERVVQPSRVRDGCGTRRGTFDGEPPTSDRIVRMRGCYDHGEATAAVARWAIPEGELLHCPTVAVGVTEEDERSPRKHLDVGHVDPALGELDRAASMSSTTS